MIARNLLAINSDLSRVQGMLKSTRMLKVDCIWMKLQMLQNIGYKGR